MRELLDNMELIITRTLPALDAKTLEYRKAREALFRSGDGFMLYLSDGAAPPRCQERLIPLGCREALRRLNENQLSEAGSFWDLVAAERSIG